MGQLSTVRIARPSLIARWKLDETEDNIASDNTGSYNAILSGNPIWQPTDGKIDGALELDGVDDYVSTPFILNAADTPFSASVWIKGTIPGQAIISQTDGTGFGGTWLGLDPSDGNFISKLMFVELKSESVIPDNNWHHLALVWDGSNRYLISGWRRDCQGCNCSELCPKLQWWSEYWCRQGHQYRQFHLRPD